MQLVPITTKVVGSNPVLVQRGRRGRDRMVVGFATTYAIGTYSITNVVSSNPVHGEVYNIM